MNSLRRADLRFSSFTICFKSPVTEVTVAADAFAVVVVGVVIAEDDDDLFDFVSSSASSRLNSAIVVSPLWGEWGGAIKHSYYWLFDNGFCNTFFIVTNPGYIYRYMMGDGTIG